jgi:hypothetical protein
MPIIGTCPACGTRAPLEAYIEDAAARRAMVALCERLAAHPAVLQRLPGYLGLHAPAGRSAAWSKIARLIAELAELVAAPVVAWDRAERPCTPELWALAMDEAQDARANGTLSVPLDGHGWLRKVAWTKAGAAESRAEAARLAAARGETPVGYSAAHRAFDAPGNPAERVAADDIRELVADLLALKRLEAANPGAHTAEITRLQRRLDQLRGPTP